MNRLKIARAASGLSLRALAAKAQVNQETISEIENGKRRAHLSTLVKLADALDISIEELTDLVDMTASQRGRLGGNAPRKQTDSLKILDKLGNLPIWSSLTPGVAIETPQPLTNTSKNELIAIQPAKKKRAPRSRQKQARYFLVAKDDAQMIPFVSREEAENLRKKLTCPAKIYEAESGSEAQELHIEFLVRQARGEAIW